VVVVVVICCVSPLVGDVVSGEPTGGLSERHGEGTELVSPSYIQYLSCDNCSSPGWTRTSNLSGTGKYHYHRRLAAVNRDSRNAP
jgi:hypothetical protein